MIRALRNDKMCATVLSFLIAALIAHSLSAQNETAQSTSEEDKFRKPCEYISRYRDLDFWIGDWEVYNQKGDRIGKNRIEKTLNGCMIFETWTASNGYFGKSMNYYDPASGKWKQNWVDAVGGNVQYVGEIKDGAMHYSGVNIAWDGTTKHARVVLTPLPDGNVRHVIEHSTDDGKTWITGFDAIYRRKNQPQD